MHIRPSQVSPNLQLEAMYAAEKAAAKREVERIRKKLMEFASKLSGEIGADEVSVAQIEAREESQEESGQQRQGDAGGQRKQNEDAESAEANSSLSDWA